MEVPWHQEECGGTAVEIGWGTWRYTCLCQLSNQELECRAPGRHQLQGHHIRAVHLLSLSSHVKTVHKIFMDQGASVSELMMLWAATGEAPLDLSEEHRDPCDHQIISFRGEEDFTELQWRKIKKGHASSVLPLWCTKVQCDEIYTTGLSVLLQFKSLGSGFFFLILLFSMDVFKRSKVTVKTFIILQNLF